MIKKVEKYGLRVVALQEIRWKEARSVDIGNMTILFGGCDERFVGTMKGTIQSWFCGI